MNRRLSFGVVLRILAVVIVLAGLVGAASPVSARDAGPNRYQKKFEIHYLKMMIDHHMEGVMMAELCLERAVHDQLLMLCEDIVDKQLEEIEMMQEWLHDWYGIWKEPSHDVEGMMSQIDYLYGRKFEVRFLKMMSGHHKMAIEESQMCLKKAYHEELKDFCQEIIVTQGREMQMMLRWLCDWYGLCWWRPM